MPESRRKNGQSANAILIVVDRLTKYTLFIPTRNDITAADFSELFFKHIEYRFSTPKSVVFDRDSRITSGYWTEICTYQQIKRHMSITYHPQTDDQSKALNRIIQDYLRAYTTEEPTAWASLLPLAEYAYNNSRNHTTESSPNRLLYGFDCEMRLNIADNVPKGRIPAAR